MGAKLNNKISFTPETRPVSVAGMFEEALFAPGVMAPHMDTSRVTEMQGMFRKAKNLKTIPAYNAAMVSNMSEMFRGSSVSEIHGGKTEQQNQLYSGNTSGFSCQYV